jgi:hypothetical protein
MRMAVGGRQTHVHNFPLKLKLSIGKLGFSLHRVNTLAF